jgi:DNA-directed RNA polymerase subunit F
MADETLQAFQLGASLYDRAQTQKRMMEQLQVQTADQVMRQRQADLQNKVQTFALGRAMKDQEDDLADVDNMNYNVQAVDTFFVDPNAPFPTFRPVKSAKNQGILNQYRQQLDDFSTRRKLMNGAQQTQQIVGGQLASVIEFANKNGLHDVVWQNNNGLNEYNQIDFNKAKTIIDAVAPKMSQQTLGKEQRETASRIGSYARLGKPAVESLIESGGIPQDIAQQTLLAAESFDKSKIGAVGKNTDLFIEAAKAKAKAVGQDLSPAKEAELRQTFIGGGGRLKALEAKTATKLEDEFAVMETIDGLQDGISEFEKQYPGKKFTDFLGVIPATEVKIRSLIETEKDPVRKEALGLLADFAGVVNRTARTTSGLNVTEGEAKRITQEIGGVFDKNSIIKLDRFRKRIEQSARGTIGRNIDKSLPSFYERWSTTPVGTRTTAAYSASAVPFQSSTQSTESMSLQEMQQIIQQLKAENEQK